MAKKKITPESETTASLPVSERSSTDRPAEEMPPVISSTQQDLAQAGSSRGFNSHTGLLLVGGIVLGLLLGFLISYVVQVKPTQQQLVITASKQVDGESSSNQIKSDLSNTRLRQQEMEIRYLTAAARLESANQYILLLRMKNLVSTAHLLVEQKNGLEARKVLADLRTLFDQLNPYILQKDAGVSQDLDDLIQTTVQDLISDPDTARTDLQELSDHLLKVENALFHVE